MPIRFAGPAAIEAYNARESGPSAVAYRNAPVSLCRASCPALCGSRRYRWPGPGARLDRRARFESRDERITKTRARTR